MGIATGRNGSGKTGTQGIAVEADDDDSGGIRGSRPPIASPREGAIILQNDLHLHHQQQQHHYTDGATSNTAGRAGLMPPSLSTSLDDVLIAASDASPDSNPAYLLDFYFGHSSTKATAETASAYAASAPKMPSALSSLKDVSQQQHHTTGHHPTLGTVSWMVPPNPAKGNKPSAEYVHSPVAHSVGSLTYGSSSPLSSSSSSSDSSQEGSPSPPSYALAAKLKNENGQATQGADRRVSFLAPLKEVDEQARAPNARPNPGPVKKLPVNELIKRICVAGVDAKLPRGRGHNRQPFCLNISEIRDVCRAAREVFLSQPTLLRLGTPVKIVGDIHGQFKDLMRIFRKCGMPPQTSYLFLGDYVDRGKQSLETIMLLLLLKIRYPNNVFMLRGNHECASVTKVYGFYDECKRRASVRAWKALVDVFNCLPIAATVGGRIFCVHGGLSPYLTSLHDIEKVSRPTDVPDNGLISDLLWSDPDPQVNEWADNDRGVSFCFGQRSLDQFCQRYHIDLVVRGHMAVEDGYEFFGKRKLVTVFSAPNYCGDFDNWGAVMSVDKDMTCSFQLLEPPRTGNKARRPAPAATVWRTSKASYEVEV